MKVDVTISETLSACYVDTGNLAGVLVVGSVTFFRREVTANSILGLASFHVKGSELKKLLEEMGYELKRREVAERE